MPKVSFHIFLQPKQQALYDLVEYSKATWIGYGGSRGGGKSGAARRIMLKRMFNHKGVRSAIFRRTYDLVRENHIEKYMQEYPILTEWYHKGDKEIRFPNGSVLCFRYAETQADVDAHIGKEYMDILVDQAESFNKHELTTLKSCTRWPGLSDSACKFILTFNPGNIGHAYLKRLFYDRKYETVERDSDYAFIQAYGWDNVEWCRSPLTDDGFPGECGGEGCGKCSSCVFYSWDGDKRFDYYIKRSQFGREQNALPPAMRVGWLLGNMDQFAGQYYDIFSKERHVIRVTPEEWSSKWISIDWGFAHESACYWWSQIGEKNHVGIYREFTGTGRSAKALAQEIIDRTPETERGRIRHIFLSHDAFSKRDERDTIADQMASVLQAAGFPYPEKGTTDTKGRAMLLYDMMGPIDPTTEKPKPSEIYIDPSCKRLIETIPMVCRDPDDLEKTLKFEGDDPVDGMFYGLTYRMGAESKPRDIEIMEQASKISDPVARFFFVHKHRKQSPNPVIVPRVTFPWETI